jgi:hypothetical protein
VRRSSALASTKGSFHFKTPSRRQHSKAERPPQPGRPSVHFRHPELRQRWTVTRWCPASPPNPRSAESDAKSQMPSFPIWPRHGRTVPHGSVDLRSCNSVPDLSWNEAYLSPPVSRSPIAWTFPDSIHIHFAISNFNQHQTLRSFSVHLRHARYVPDGPPLLPDKPDCRVFDLVEQPTVILPESMWPGRSVSTNCRPELTYSGLTFP